MTLIRRMSTIELYYFFHFIILFFFFQAEDGIRDLVRSRGLGDVYKRQALAFDDSNYLEFSTGEANKLTNGIGDSKK